MTQPVLTWAADTRKHGKPDMVKLTYKLVEEFKVCRALASVACAHMLRQKNNAGRGRVHHLEPKADAQGRVRDGQPRNPRCGRAV